MNFRFNNIVCIESSDFHSFMSMYIIIMSKFVSMSVACESKRVKFSLDLGSTQIFKTYTKHHPQCIEKHSIYILSLKILE